MTASENKISKTENCTCEHKAGFYTVKYCKCCNKPIPYKWQAASNIHKKLRDARLAKGITQRKVAKDLGFHPASLSNFEGGRNPLCRSNIRRYADYLGIKI